MDGDENQGAPLSANEMPSKGEPTKQSLSTTETSQQSTNQNSTNSLTSQHISALQHLDKQHKHLVNVEKSLQKYLEEYSFRSGSLLSHSSLQ